MISFLDFFYAYFPYQRFLLFGFFFFPFPLFSKTVLLAVLFSSKLEECITKPFVLSSAFLFFLKLFFILV